jgi:DNA repair photolyase
MPLKKVKSGSNMYEWISHCHAHLGGECSHKCKYCYVDNPIGGRPEKFTGKVRLLEDEFKVNYGEGKTIFIEHMNDLFAKDVALEDIKRVLRHCKEYPKNTYMFQTKNPARFFEVMDSFPINTILGITIETNRVIEGISEAPTPYERYMGMWNVPKTTPMFSYPIKTFVTIEPVLDFDVDIFAKWIGEIKPDFINLGADSKNHNLPEPTVEKIMAFVEELKKYGIELREKHNLQRLKPK